VRVGELRGQQEAAARIERGGGEWRLVLLGRARLRAKGQLLHRARVGG
jgi:hypothetical protein